MLSTIRNKLASTGVYAAGDFAVKILQFAIYPIVTSILSPAQIGILGLMNLVRQGSMHLFTLGTQGAATSFYHSFSGDERKRFYYTLQVLVTILTVFFSLLFVILGEEVSMMIFNRDLYQPYMKITIATVAVTVLFITIPERRFLATNDARRYTLLSSGRQALQQIIPLIFVITLTSLSAYLYGQLVGAGIIAIAGLYYSRQISFSVVEFDTSKAIQTLTYSLPLFPHLYASFMISMIDRALLSQYLSLEQVGIYTVAYGLTGALIGVIRAANNSMFSNFSAIKADEERINELTRLATYYILFTGLMAVGFRLISPAIITLLFGPEYSSGILVVGWLSIAYFLLSIYHLPTNAIMLIREETKYMPLISIVAVVANLASNLVLIPELGIVGAAVSTLIAYLCQASMAILVATHLFEWTFEYMRIGKVFLTVILISGSYSIVGSTKLLPSILLTTVGVVCYILILLILKFPTDSEFSMACGKLSDLISI